MKAKFFFIALIAIACIACEPSNPSEDLTKLEEITLDEIFYEGNYVIRRYTDPILNSVCDKCEKGKHTSESERAMEHASIVEVIGSQEELLALCPEGTQPPELDFNECCIVWAGVSTGSMGNTFSAAELEDLGDGNYCFHCTIKIRQHNCAIGYVYPYAVYSITKDQIKNLQKDIVYDYGVGK